MTFIIEVQNTDFHFRNTVSIRYGMMVFYDRTGGSAATEYPNVTGTYDRVLTIGIWHGTGWNYIIRGLFCGVIIAGSTCFSKEIGNIVAILKIDTENPGWKAFWKVKTFLLFIAARFIVLDSVLEIWGRICEGLYLG